MSFVINGANGGAYGATRIQKEVVDGNTYYSRSKGAHGPNGNSAGSHWVVADMGSDGTLDGGMLQKGATNNQGQAAAGTVIVTPDGVNLGATVVNGQTSATWSKYF